MELSQKLKELRKKQGLTQLELAERLFVSRQAISGWEAGTSRPSTENLQSLSRLFNIPLETLLDDTAEAEPAAAPEKLPAEEQAKEEGKGQGLGKDRRYKAIATVMCMALAVTANAVEYDSSISRYYGTGNCSYTAYSALYADGGSRYRAATWVETMNGGNVAAGNMGANGRLYSASGTLLKDTGMMYNTSSYYFQVASISTAKSSPSGAYSWGEVDLYNGDHFVSDTLNKTEIVGAARALAYQLDDGNYPVSDKGKTYGSALLSEIVGHEPDLISAVGTDGQAGYVKYEDVKKPEIKNPSEAVSYMQDRQETYTVPLYDLQEEVIGEFEIGCAMDVTGYSLEEAKEMVNLGERAGSVLSVEQTSLINGNFPKNVRGETYGTALMAEVVGEMPDLQAAIGTNDQEGYVRTSDLSHPKFETPQDALEWQKTQPDSYYIPLYDFQGNEIGSFLRERNNLTIAEMEAMKG